MVKTCSSFRLLHDSMLAKQRQSMLTRRRSISSIRTMRMPIPKKWTRKKPWRFSGTGCACPLTSKTPTTGILEHKKEEHNIIIQDNIQERFSFLSKQAATASPSVPLHYRWWYAVPPANLVHLAIGSVYVYSMWTPGMVTTLGVFAPSSHDWTYSAVLPVFSASAVCLGWTTAGLGSWVESVGPRKAAFVGSIFWASALATTAAGVRYHSLPLVYLGWGLLGGVGWGLMYLAPVTTVMKWFPDRRGLATGIALSAFGTGAAIAPGIIQRLIDFYAVAPDYIGPLAELTHGLSPDDCVTLATLADGTQVVAENSAVGIPGEPVVVATEADIARLSPAVSSSSSSSAAASGSHSPGAYLLGTGDTGTAKALATMGLLNGTMGMIGARFMSSPHPNWSPTGPLVTTTSNERLRAPTDNEPHEVKDEKADETVVNTHNVGLPVSYVMTQTTQFPLLWLSVFGNAAGGLALLSSSKLMISDIWMGTAPDIVTASFATVYVSALGIGMAVGRFGWSALSDTLGRRNTYAVFGLGIPIVGMAPALAHAAVAGNDVVGTSILPLLSTFCGGSVLAITFYGGIFSVLPAYIADLFGQKHAGAIHGKLLTAWAASAVAGPMGLAYLRSRASDSAMSDLLHNHIAPHDAARVAFYESFGCTSDNAKVIETLIDAKTITIARLLDFVPTGTVDPTPFLYDTTCYTAAGLMAVSFIANLLIKPLDVNMILSQIKTTKDENNGDP